jgi:hypothetical protein
MALFQNGLICITWRLCKHPKPWIPSQLAELTALEYQEDDSWFACRSLSFNQIKGTLLEWSNLTKLASL